MSKFLKRVYGFVAVKSINSNYNADFSGQPRTLPNGTVYATDKALKYTIRHFIKNNYNDQKIFFYKRMDKDNKPISLDETYERLFGSASKGKKKEIVLKNLLTCIDIRLFGATFAGAVNVSIHGPVQINHGINIWHENNIYSEQISSPFSNKKDSDNKEMTTLGRQSRLEEGHYIHHFSINPKNIENLLPDGSEELLSLTDEDISILKEGLRKGVTYYDSASKAGSENEILFYVELKENSKLVMPNFSQMLSMERSDSNGKRVFDFTTIKDELSKYSEDIEKCELYYNENCTIIKNIPGKCKVFDLING